MINSKIRSDITCEESRKCVKADFMGSRIVIPDKLRKQTLQLAHEGHQGIVKTKLRLREKVWWPGIDQDAENLVKSCRACQVVGPVPKQEPIKRTQLPDGPWQDLCADLMGPFPTGEYVFVVVDYYSRWQEVAILKSVTTDKIIRLYKCNFMSTVINFVIWKFWLSSVKVIKSNGYPAIRD
ncbi:unnamed protein product [Mytilus edulis]|uniref:Integrase zinc-binding domain-containing protein n=1 Tax=Mytilus edulis TaxID=6550 RepID=A0A8S3U889_MYTED|nr:unnamed protein product [Mytilus edulis]